MTALRRFLHSERGATAIEYALIASCIFLVIVTTVAAIGPKLNSIFASVNAGFSGN